MGTSERGDDDRNDEESKRGKKTGGGVGRFESVIQFKLSCISHKISVLYVQKSLAIGFQSHTTPYDLVYGTYL